LKADPSLPHSSKQKRFVEAPVARDGNVQGLIEDVNGANSFYEQVRNLRRIRATNVVSGGFQWI